MGYRNPVTGRAMLDVAFGPGSQLDPSGQTRSAVTGGIENPIKIEHSTALVLAYTVVGLAAAVFFIAI